ncbi:MAG: hypothetical protein WDZ80_05160 [Candidatus Paceibacterota bacterium]
MKNYYIILPLLVLGLGFPFLGVSAQEESKTAECGLNTVTITGESRAPYCGAAEVVSCTVSSSEVVEEASQFTCPSNCSVKSEVSTKTENLTCSEWFNPTFGPSIYKATCEVVASFTCGSEDNSIVNTNTSLEEITTSISSINIKEIEEKIDIDSEPGLKRAISDFSRFIGSFFSF